MSQDETQAGSELSERLGRCECLFWASHDLGRVMLTGHHENCKKAPQVMACTRKLLTDLVRGIETWAGFEDGVPDEVWPAYAKAKAIIGEPVEQPIPIDA